MMDPLDFLTIANKLKKKNKEMHWRTSIGRSYYGVFNYLRDECNKIGISISRGPATHEILRNMFFNSNVDAASDIGSKIEDLFQQRNIADYEMQTEVNGKTADTIYRKARGIIETFGTINKADLKQGMESYKASIQTARKSTPSL